VDRHDKDTPSRSGGPHYCRDVPVADAQVRHFCARAQTEQGPSFLSTFSKAQAGHAERPHNRDRLVSFA
jgi:hypothetical protein